MAVDTVAAAVGVAGEGCLAVKSRQAAEAVLWRRRKGALVQNKAVEAVVTGVTYGAEATAAWTALQIGHCSPMQRCDGYDACGR